MSFYSAARSIFGFQDKDFEAITKLPQGFSDGTYGNDTCPSIFHEINLDDGYYVTIYIDYKDMEDREEQNNQRYMIDIMADDEYMLLSDDWQEVLEISPIAIKICDLLHQGEKNKAKTLMDKYNFETV